MLDARHDVQRLIGRQFPLLFKGGTSLSKSFGRIDRYFEDIDITVFRDDLSQPATFLELEQMSGKRRRRRLDAIEASCQAYITEDFLGQLDVPRLNLRVGNVTSVNPEHTLWDKVVILHGQRRWYERRGVLRADDRHVDCPGTVR